MIDGKEAALRTTLVRELRSKFGADVTDIALAISPAIGEASAHGRSSVVIPGIQPALFDKLTECLTELSFEAREAPPERDEILNQMGQEYRLKKVLISW